MAIGDMIRNEKPIVFETTQKYVRTGLEPTGEEES